MPDNIRVLETKISQVLEKLETIKAENGDLQTENRALKNQFNGLKQEFDRFRMEHNDQVEAVKSKLATLLGRIEELEHIGL